MSSAVMAAGTAYPPKAVADGARVGQPPWSSGTESVPRQGAYVEALRPACASWNANGTPCSWENATIGSHASACASDQIPASSGVMRPSATTAAASLMTRPARPIANEP